MSIAEAVEITRFRTPRLFRHEGQRDEFRKACDAVRTRGDVDGLVSQLKASPRGGARDEAEDLLLRLNGSGGEPGRFPVTTRKYPVVEE